jgi:hypothetical protein
MHITVLNAHYGSGVVNDLSTVLEDRLPGFLAFHHQALMQGNFHMMQ